MSKTTEDKRLHNTPIAPYWSCVYNQVSRQDPRCTPFIQRLLLFVTIVIQLPLLLSVKTFGEWIFGVDESYFTFDDSYYYHHEVASSPSNNNMLSELVMLTTGLSSVSILVCATITIAFYTTLIWLDVTSTNQRPFQWPISWETNNNACYNDMFCEPSRNDRVIRRPGNTLSNIFYFFAALVVLLSSYTRYNNDETTTTTSLLLLSSRFILSDLLFGSMLFILAISSTIWHSCNAFWSHSVDLWSMDAVILYLPIRTISLGSFVILHNNNILKDADHASSSSTIASLICLGVYTGLILINGRRHYDMYTTRFFDDGFPLAVRHRLPCSPYVMEEYWGDKRMPVVEAIGIVEVHLFAMIPAFSCFSQWILIRTLFHSVGSVCLARIVNISLLVGWEYRIFERWGFDGCVHMLYCHKKINAAIKRGNEMHSFLWTALAAVLSPTAVLHYCTGITLLAAFCYHRSLEMIVWERIANETG